MTLVKGGCQMGALGRRMRSGPLLFVVLALVATLAACGGDDSTQENGGGQPADSGEEAGEQALPEYDGPEARLPEGYPAPERRPSEQIRMGVMVPTSAEFGKVTIEAATAQAAKLGVEVIARYDRADVDTQVTNFDQLLAQQVDAIYLYPLDPKAIGPLLQEAQEQNVAVIASDVVRAGEKPPAGITSTILGNRDQSAYLQVAEMARLHPRGKIGVIGLGFPVAALQYYVERVKYWAERAGLEVVGQQDNPNDDVSGGQQAATALLAQHPDVQGVIAYNDPSALGATAAARSAGVELTAIGLNGGSEGRSGVESGRMAATVQVPVPALGVNIVNAAVDLAIGPAAKLPPVVQIPATLVNEDNLVEIPSWDQQVDEIGSDPGFAAP
jgi:ribose transport system substrate-binding protein